MSSPAKVTDSASGLSRRPPHTGHGLLTRYAAARSRMRALLLLAKECSTWRRALLKVPM